MSSFLIPLQDLSFQPEPRAGASARLKAARAGAPLAV